MLLYRLHNRGIKIDAAIDRTTQSIWHYEKKIKVLKKKIQEKENRKLQLVNERNEILKRISAEHTEDTCWYCFNNACPKATKTFDPICEKYMDLPF